MALLSGGNVNNAAAAGLFAFNANNAPSNANWNVGASQSYKQTINNACTFPHAERWEN